MFYCERLVICVYSKIVFAKNKITDAEMTKK